MFKFIASRYNNADAIITMAVMALIYFAWRQATVDLAGFGEGVAGILAGRGAHAWGTAQGQGQQ